jgi:exodeoxyribonuclease V alpha subunit
MRVLCAHRRGPSGVAGWTARIERWLAESIDGYAADGPWYTGRPLLVTENDYGLRLYNGDTGVIVRSPTRCAVAAFRRAGSIFEISPRRIAAVDTVHAMTIHKSQGSQFDTVAVVLPEPTSPILTRELLYTAVTRAQRRVIVVGSQQSVQTAVVRPIARATGLREHCGPSRLTFKEEHQPPRLDRARHCRLASGLLAPMALAELGQRVLGELIAANHRDLAVRERPQC